MVLIYILLTYYFFQLDIIHKFKQSYTTSKVQYVRLKGNFPENATIFSLSYILYCSTVLVCIKMTYFVNLNKKNQYRRMKMDQQKFRIFFLITKIRFVGLRFDLVYFSGLGGVSQYAVVILHTLLPLPPLPINSTSGSAENLFSSTLISISIFENHHTFIRAV